MVKTHFFNGKFLTQKQVQDSVAKCRQPCTRVVSSLSSCFCTFNSRGGGGLGASGPRGIFFMAPFFVPCCWGKGGPPGINKTCIFVTCTRGVELSRVQFRFNHKPTPAYFFSLLYKRTQFFCRPRDGTMPGPPQLGWRGPPGLRESGEAEPWLYDEYFTSLVAT